MGIRLTQSLFCVLISCSAAFGILPASALAQTSSAPFLSSILRLPQLTLQSLLRAQLIRPLGGNVYGFSDGGNAWGHEVSAGRQLAALSQRSVLVFGQMPGIGEMPAFDGLLFSRDGRIEANVTMKSLQGVTDRYEPVEHLIRRARDAARGTLKVNAPEQFQHLLSTWSVGYLERAVLRRLLGAEGPLRERPTIAVVDARGMSNWAARVQMEPWEGRLIRTLDVLVDGVAGTYPIRLAELVRDLSPAAGVRELVFLFKNGYVSAKLEELLPAAQAPVGLRGPAHCSLYFR